MNGGMVFCWQCGYHAGKVVVEKRQVGHGEFASFAHVECTHCGRIGPEVDDFFNPNYRKDAKAKFKQA